MILVEEGILVKVNNHDNTKSWKITMTNFKRIKNMTKEELSEEIRLIASWDKKKKRIAEQDEDFYTKLLYVRV
ncbi:hypothetical protein CHL78_005555 [Romboutsia weinsteinii]|uniref:Uncharacterized protein n=1 Tax=Romboutsia weinsteinii TaxID=2020949 RepID=A0A371J6R4_9FIRM|nr:hypothetical protein [Romboutsia weinsteinii]RDY28367.1 hypothetical protein CHL78_005555 [Romboutsia weinsteinii]